MGRSGQGFAQPPHGARVHPERGVHADREEHARDGGEDERDFGISRDDDGERDGERVVDDGRVHQGRTVDALFRHFFGLLSFFF